MKSYAIEMRLNVIGEQFIVILKSVVLELKHTEITIK